MYVSPIFVERTIGFVQRKAVRKTSAAAIRPRVRNQGQQGKPEHSPALLVHCPAMGWKRSRVTAVQEVAGDKHARERGHIAPASTILRQGRPTTELHSPQ